MRRTLPLLLLLVTFSIIGAESPGAAPPFQSGDVVTWVGDSITHGGTYHAVVELFYATRFPDRKIRYYNDGISGDRASGIMSDEAYRLKVDILAHQPTVAPIMLGMNDVNRNDYGSDKTGPEFDQKHQSSLDLYSQSMRQLMDALTKAGARLILIQPSIFDQTTALPGAGFNAIGSNDALSKCSLMIVQWAKQYHAGIVNFFGVMNEINQREQKKDPAYTLVGKDRIHPGPVGHFVMAYTFLKAQGMPQVVAVIDVNAKKEKAGAVVNGEVRHIRRTATGVEFDAFEKSLPLVVPDAAKPALDLVPFVSELNQETLMVEGLGKGDYTLKIDDQDAGAFTASQLEAGVNLAENPKTPQYQQSAGATKISAERTKTGATLRDIAAQKYNLSKAKVDVADIADVERRIRDQQSEAKEAGKPVNRAWDLVLQDLAEPGKLMQQYDDLSVQLLQVCQTREHHFALIKK